MFGGLPSTALSSAYSPAKLGIRLPLGPPLLAVRMSPSTRERIPFCLGEVSRENGAIAEGALVVDTEPAGFFREADRDSIEFCLREFGARLRLEMLLIALLAPRGGSATP